MPMERYHTLAGEVIEYPAAPADLARFLARAIDEAHDPDIGESAFTALIYGRDNPLLDQTVFPDRGMVTPEAKRHPIFRILLDLLEQKRIQAGTLQARRDPDGPMPADPAHTMTVDRAASLMAVSAGTIRRLVKQGELVGSGRGESLRLDGEAVERWIEEHDIAGETRRFAMVGDVEGAVADLQILMGRRGGAELQVKYKGALDDVTTIGANQAGTLRRWRAVGVLLADEGTCVFHVLRPGPRREVVALRGFFVRGAFDVTQTITDAEMARAAFDTFEPA